MECIECSFGRPRMMVRIVMEEGYADGDRHKETSTLEETSRGVYVIDFGSEAESMAGRK